MNFYQDDAKGDSPENLFARNFTEHYHEISSYFPEFLRLEQLVKISAAVDELRRIREQNHSKILEKEFRMMGLPDVPVTPEILSAASLRAPAIHHQYKDAATNLHQRIYGGVVALPKFTNKISDKSSKFFKTNQERTALRAKEFTAYNSRNPNPGNQSASNNKKNYAKFFQEHFAAENAKRFKPIQSNPCSTSAFIHSALAGGYDALDMTGRISHTPPNPVKAGLGQFRKAVSCLSTGGGGSKEEHPGAEKMGLYLGGMAIGLYEQWKACKASKKDAPHEPAEKESHCDAIVFPKFGL